MSLATGTSLILNHLFERAEKQPCGFKEKSPPPQPQRTRTAAPSTSQSPAGATAPTRPEPASASSLTVQQLEKRLKKLEEELSNLTAKHPQIHIDTLHIHQPVLENLTFRLDHLDIKELSGSLNLGNNFGAKPNEKKALSMRLFSVLTCQKNRTQTQPNQPLEPPKENHPLQRSQATTARRHRQSEPPLATSTRRRNPKRNEVFPLVLLHVTDVYHRLDPNRIG